MAAKVAGSWAVISPVGVADLTTIDTTKKWDLGQRCKAKDMSDTTAYGLGEFIYLGGVASTVRGSVVFINDDFTTTLVVARSASAIAVALAANTSATTYGWYQILGKGVAACDGVSAAAACYIDGTAGRIDDSAVAGDQVMGMRTVSGDDTGTCVVNMTTYPATADFDNA